MNLRLAPGSAVPVYRQIVDQLAYQIGSGRLTIGERLPSVRELARALPANQNTVLKAYEILENDGLIERRHGDGTFVAQRGSPLRIAERRRMVAELLAQAAALAANLEINNDEFRKLAEDELSRVAPRESETTESSRPRPTEPRAPASGDSRSRAK